MPIDFQAAVGEPLWNLLQKTENDPLYNNESLDDRTLDSLLEFRLDLELRHVPDNPNGSNAFSPQDLVNTEYIPVGEYPVKNIVRMPNGQPQQLQPGYGKFPGQMNSRMPGSSHMMTLGMQPPQQQQMLPGPSPRYPIAPSPGNNSGNHNQPMMMNRTLPDYNNPKMMQPPMMPPQSPMTAAMSPNNGYPRMAAPMHGARIPEHAMAAKHRFQGQLFSPPGMNMSNEQRLSADSPMSQTSADSSSGKRKRTDDDDSKEGTPFKKPKNNLNGESYSTVIDFIRRSTSNCPLLLFLLGECQTTEKISKRAVDFKDDELRTIVVLKPRVFCDNWKKFKGLTEKSSSSPTYQKMEKELESYEKTCRIGGFAPAIRKVKPREFQLLPTLKGESKHLRLNQSMVGLVHNEVVELMQNQIPGPMNQQQNGLPPPQMNGFPPQPQMPLHLQQPQQHQNGMQAGTPQPFSPSSRMIPGSAGYMQQHHRIADQIASK